MNAILKMTWQRSQRKSKTVAARKATAVKRSAPVKAKKATPLAKPKKAGVARTATGMAALARRRRPRRKKYILGSSKIFTPEVINDIHIKSELGRYRMRGFSLFKKIPHWDDLTFLPGTLTRFVIEGYREKCETKTIIGPTRQAAHGARHPDLRHRHVLRRPVL